MVENEVPSNGKVLECFLTLQGLERLFNDGKHESICDEIKMCIQLLCHLSAENNTLKKNIFDFEDRLKVIDWSFGGGIT